METYQIVATAVVAGWVGYFLYRWFYRVPLDPKIYDDL